MCLIRWCLYDCGQARSPLTEMFQSALLRLGKIRTMCAWIPSHVFIVNLQYNVHQAELAGMRTWPACYASRAALQSKSLVFLSRILLRSNCRRKRRSFTWLCLQRETFFGNRNSIRLFLIGPAFPDCNFSNQTRQQSKKPTNYHQQIFF